MASIPISGSFPSGYGDMKIIASDGVTFYFPSFLLMHMSPVLRDSLNDIRPPGHSSVPGDPTVSLNTAYPSDVIEAILRLCDPKKEEPSFDSMPSQSAFLEAGHRWKIERVLGWWEKKANETLEKYRMGYRYNSFSPEMALILASRFQASPVFARTCLRVLILEPYTQLLTELSKQEYPLYPPLFIHLLQLRQERTRFICEKITRRHNDMRSCSNCSWFGLGLGHAVRDLILQVMETPSWRTLSAWSFEGCRCERKNDQLIGAEWEEDILRQENLLPPLPDDWQDRPWMESAQMSLTREHSVQAE
ncbi:hypothetical protein PIIN_10622 [Serendipita indica DSM 11827]|uniref:BTB domain-containing protein n=1 Tax=Serendipita indica (strain DSM 11827) TaxID=1109443 RepID=G4TZ88_SERID|nr:hypothetical protein PIIN_10622 [Serendipita indica DSM 11827]